MRDLWFLAITFRIFTINGQPLLLRMRLNSSRVSRCISLSRVDVFPSTTNLVDSASSHMLVSRIKPCKSESKRYAWVCERLIKTETIYTVKSIFIDAHWITPLQETGANTWSKGVYHQTAGACFRGCTSLLSVTRTNARKGSGQVMNQDKESKPYGVTVSSLCPIN